MDSNEISKGLGELFKGLSEIGRALYKFCSDGRKCIEQEMQKGHTQRKAEDICCTKGGHPPHQ
jgi:hypothetical protein